MPVYAGTPWSNSAALGSYRPNAANGMDNLDVGLPVTSAHLVPALRGDLYCTCCPSALTLCLLCAEGGRAWQTQD